MVVDRAAVHGWLDRVRANLAARGRWASRAQAFVLGGLAVLAMPPLYQIYLLVPALVFLVWQADAQPTRWRAFTLGWWFGAGYFAAGLYWVSFALLVEADKFAWLIPVAIFGFAFGFGLFWATAAWVVKVTPGGYGAKVLALVGAWTLLEWLRTWLFTGFPWNPLGSIWFFSDITAQGVAVVGVLGMGFVAALAAASPAALADRGRGGPVLVGLSVAILVVLVAGGQHRLSNATDRIHDGVRLRLIQPNIRQDEKWDPAKREQHMMNQVDLSLAPPKDGGPRPTHIIWSETAAPFFIGGHRPWRRIVGGTLRAHDSDGLVIFGAPRALTNVPANDPATGLQVANSLLAVDAQGVIRATYDKFHLVPFGEYVPLKEWLPLERITQGAGAFTPGPGPRTLDLQGLPPVSPLICYEIIFPGEVTDGTGRAQWLLNLTNDAWYGKTAGPHQHFVSARARALEQGLPVVRVAGSGISGIIDAYGRVRAELPLGEKGFADGDLPVPAARPARYSQWGSVPALTLALGALVFAGGMGLRRGN